MDGQGTGVGEEAQAWVALVAEIHLRRDGDIWLGYLDPDYWTQGETREEQREGLRSC